MNELQFGMLLGELVSKRAKLLRREKSGFAGRGELVMYTPRCDDADGAAADVTPVRAIVLKYHGAPAGVQSKTELQPMSNRTGEPMGPPISRVTPTRFTRAPRPKNQSVTYPESHFEFGLRHGLAFPLKHMEVILREIDVNTLARKTLGWDDCDDCDDP